MPWGPEPPDQAGDDRVIRPVDSDEGGVLLLNGRANPDGAGLDPAIATGATVEKVVLMAPGANTHAIDMHQRYVQLQVPSNTTSTSITYAAPTSAAHAPKGWYMMFLVSGSGAPSEARWVKLE